MLLEDPPIEKIRVLLNESILKKLENIKSTFVIVRLVTCMKKC